MSGFSEEVKQSCSVLLTLCNLVDCSLPGSSIHGILQARILEWVAISFSRGSSRPRDEPRSPSEPPGKPQVDEWMSGLVPLNEDQLSLPPSFSTHLMRMKWADRPNLQTNKKKKCPPRDTQSTGAWIWDFQLSELWEINVCCLSHSSMVIYYSSPNWLWPYP